MGACCAPASGRPEYARPAQQQAAERAPVGGNKPLKAQKPVWTSESSMTVSQLKSKRDEFWDTAPKYEGRREIWDALKAACETEDVTLAQAILDSANIFLPTGVLTDAYDELGNKYTIPVYCISEPTNLVNDDGSSRSGGDANRTASRSSLAEQRGREIALKVRLSTMKDLKLTMNENDSIRNLKEQVQELEKIPIDQQRVFLTGQPLADKTKLRELSKLSEGAVIQILVKQ